MRARRRHPLANIVVAASLLGAQGAGFLHLALVEHERCAEHGEILEARHGHRPAGPAAGPAVTRAAFTGEPAATHAHDHCLALVGRRASAPPAPTVAAAFVLQHRASASPLRTRPVVPPGPPLYRLAPKSSPPAA